MGADVAGSALVDEALKKAGLVWIGLAGTGPDRAYWYAWQGGKLYLLTGGDEQPDPGWTERAQVDVLVRSKETTERLVVFRATVTLGLATDGDWVDATAELAKQRLNLTDADHAAERWADIHRHRVYRLTPDRRDPRGAGRTRPGLSRRWRACCADPLPRHDEGPTPLGPAPPRRAPPPALLTHAPRA